MFADVPEISKNLHSRRRQWSMGKILVTGATGFIGRVVVEKLLVRGESVIGFSRSPGQNILNGRQIHDALQFCDRIIHLAARVDFSLKTRDKTECLLMNATQFPLKKIVFVSSAITMGTQKDPGIVMDESFFAVESINNPYLHSKLIGELTCIRSGLPVVIVNPSTAGPISSMAAPPGGTNIVDVRDVADGIIAALDHGRPRERYLLTDRNITFRELYPYALPLPRWSKNLCKRLCWDQAFLIENAFNYKYYDNSKARRELGWKPKQSWEKPTGNFMTLWHGITRRQTAGEKTPLG